MSTKVNWFELPTSDLDRASAFWSTVMATELHSMDAPDGEMRAFMDNEGPVGALVTSAENTPSNTGIRIYLDAAGDLDGVLGRVEAAGGTIVVPKTSIGEYGWIAQVKDTEGNLVGLHTM